MRNAGVLVCVLFGISLANVPLPSYATTVLQCKVGKIVSTMNHGGKEIQITVFAPNEYPELGMVDTSYCEHKEDSAGQKESRALKNRMVISDSNREIVIPKRCYNGEVILFHTMRISWDKEDLMLSFDLYSYDEKKITSKTIYRMNDEYLC